MKVVRNIIKYIHVHLETKHVSCFVCPYRDKESEHNN